MILRFPDTGTLESAIESGLVLDGPTRGCANIDGSTFVEVSDFAKKQLQSLQDFGVFEAENPPSELKSRQSILELLPLKKQSVGLRRTGRQFLLSCRDGGVLVRTIAELRRLGRRAEGFRWYGVGKRARCLLRIVDPPEAVLLRAKSVDDSIVTWSEIAPRVWIVAGYEHPLQARIRAPRGRMLLIPNDAIWMAITDGPFQPIDARMADRLPAQTACLRDESFATTIHINFKLCPRKQGAAEAELAVFDDDAVTRLRAFVNTAGSDQLDELEIAVSEAESRKVVVLRGNQCSSIIGAAAFAPVLKLPQIQMPASSELAPCPRRDWLREHLTFPDRITWLSPADNGGIAVRTVPTKAFQRLQDWVKHIAPSLVRLQVVEAHCEPFAMLPFQEKSIALPRGSMPQIKFDPEEDVKLPTPAAPAITVVRGQAPQRVVNDLKVLPELADAALLPDALRQRLIELQKQFLDIDGPLDHPDRLALWPPLAECHSLLGEDADAALCWANAIWANVVPPETLVKLWFRAEWDVGTRADLSHELAKLLTAQEITAAGLRALAVWLLHAVESSQQAGGLAGFTRLILQHEIRMPVRIAWLAWVAIAKLSGSDVLALTRTRDRLLNQLLESGLHRDRDLPAFLHGGPREISARGPINTSRLRDLHERALLWNAGSVSFREPLLRISTNLTFAYAIARFGDVDGCKQFLDEVCGYHVPPRSRTTWDLPDEALPPDATWLRDAYLARIRQRLQEGSSPSGISRTQMRGLGKLTPAEKHLVNRFRQFSHILEPHERTDPYRAMRVFGDDALGLALADLPANASCNELEQHVRALLQSNSRPRNTFRILAAAVPLAFRCGDSFALELLRKVAATRAAMAPIYDMNDLIGWVRLVERALGLAAHHDLTSLIPELAGTLEPLMDRVAGERAAWLCGALSGQSFRFLSRLGLRDRARDFFEKLAEAVLGKQSISGLLKSPATNRPVIVAALLRLAGGWFYFEDDKPARTAIEAARQELYSGTLSPQSSIDLACILAETFGQAPLALGLAGFEELLEKLKFGYGDQTRETIMRLRLIETIALAASGEEFSNDASVRRILDEDEFLVRQRIHRDVNEAVQKAGL